MSLRPEEIPPVPEETRRVAQAAFARGNLYMHLRDELGAIYNDQLFAALFPARGQPAASPWRLEPDASMAVCREAGYTAWRDRVLTPVTTLPLFL
jgi:hypothetical protein